VRLTTAGSRALRPAAALARQLRATVGRLRRCPPGPQNSARVREWRARHPDYWRKKKPAPRDALQESCCAQRASDQEIAPPVPPDPLQELCVMQPAVIVGLISTISGCALQEDIVRIARSFIARGQDIPGMRPGAAFVPSYKSQAHPLPRTAAR
jgi:hypothetical protein